jgi:hypothetical protein
MRLSLKSLLRLGNLATDERANETFCMIQGQDAHTEAMNSAVRKD